MASDINGIRWKQGRVGQATPTEAPPSTIDKVPASETKSPDFDIAFARQLVQHRQRHDVNDSQSRHMRNDELDALQRLLQAFDAIAAQYASLKDTQADLEAQTKIATSNLVLAEANAESLEQELRRLRATSVPQQRSYSASSATNVAANGDFPGMATAFPSRTPTITTPELAQSGFLDVSKSRPTSPPSIPPAPDMARDRSLSFWKRKKAQTQHATTNQSPPIPQVGFPAVPSLFKDPASTDSQVSSASSANEAHSLPSLTRSPVDSESSFAASQELVLRSRDVAIADATDLRAKLQESELKYAQLQADYTAVDGIRADLILENTKLVQTHEKLQKEVESLSQALFEEANKMVADEKRKRAEAEAELAECRRELQLLSSKENQNGTSSGAQDLLMQPRFPVGSGDDAESPMDSAFPSKGPETSKGIATADRNNKLRLAIPPVSTGSTSTLLKVTTPTSAEAQDRGASPSSASAAALNWFSNLRNKRSFPMLRAVTAPAASGTEIPPVPVPSVNLSTPGVPAGEEAQVIDNKQTTASSNHGPHETPLETDNNVSGGQISTSNAQKMPQIVQTPPLKRSFNGEILTPMTNSTSLASIVSQAASEHSMESNSTHRSYASSNGFGLSGVEGINQAAARLRPVGLVLGSHAPRRAESEESITSMGKFTRRLAKLQESPSSPAKQPVKRPESDGQDFLSYKHRLDTQDSLATVSTIPWDDEEEKGFTYERPNLKRSQTVSITSCGEAADGGNLGTDNATISNHVLVPQSTDPAPETPRRGHALQRSLTDSTYFQKRAPLDLITRWQQEQTSRRAPKVSSTDSRNSGLDDLMRSIADDLDLDERFL